MILSNCKRLIEVDFPIAAVSIHSAREKSIRHGHPSTLHLWWARRPLAACRAVLMGLLLPDPVDEKCPPQFKEDARKILTGIDGIGPKTDLDLRKALLSFIADFADWDNSSDEVYLKRARGLVKAAHPEETPLVVDPFAGGGSIPLEALRVGCEAFASDLNPVACLILKVMLEDIPRYGPKLAEELRKAGAEIKAQAEKELAEFYPPDPDGARPIAYLWARTVRCEAPNCGAEIPLMRSFWLCKKANRKQALRHKVVRPKDESPQVEFEIFDPKSEKEVPGETVTRAKATCICCGTVLPPERVRAQLFAQRGGADVIFDGAGHRKGGARLLAVVTLKEAIVGRHYRLPVERDYDPIQKAMARLKKIEKIKLPNELSLVPEEPTPEGGGSGAGRAFSVQKYGMLQWGDLFTMRQKVAFVSISKAIRDSICRMTNIPIDSLVAMICTKLTDRCNSLVNWSIGVECPNQLFKGTALPTAWDFAESNLISDSSASVSQTIENIERNVEVSYIPGSKPSSPQLADACEYPLPDATANIWFTDPPYGDQVPYSDLSDFFFVWFKRIINERKLVRDPFDLNNPLTPKIREIVEDERKIRDGKPKDTAYFHIQMAKAFREGVRVTRDDGIGCVVFANKKTEEWEALLSGMVKSGWVLTGSWPITTERYSRVRARESAALAGSVHLIIRPRPIDIPIGGWEEILQDLPTRISQWVDRLSNEGIRGADLVFSCIGPAMELFSRHPRVETSDGREVKLDEFLTKVWEVLGRIALQRVLGGGIKPGEPTGALEEDARLTALFLWTLQSTANGNGKAKKPAKAGKALSDSEECGEIEEDETNDEDKDQSGSKGKVKGGFSLPYDIARRFAQPLGIHLEEWEGRVIDTDKGVVRLLPVTERAARLFGKEGAEAVAKAIEERKEKTTQLTLFPDERKGAAPELMRPGPMDEGVEGKEGKGKGRGRKGKAPSVAREATTLDRLHAAMLLQRAGQSAAMKVLLEEERTRGPDFERLANALSALYPVKSEEKRLLDAMLLAMPKR